MPALTWNLFHGRDFPPDPALLTARSRVLGLTERGTGHAQVNRPLLDEYVRVLARHPWDVALLQEAPPYWLEPLGRALGAHGALALTSRNVLPAPRRWLHARRPDLLGAWEGGSNQLLVRPPWRITHTHRLTVARLPERRRMLWARLAREGGAELCVAVVHLTTRLPAAARREAATAAGSAVRWSGNAPLLFGGDLNLSPRSAPEAFEELQARHGLGPPTAPGAIDHLLARGLRVVEPPRALPDAGREVPGPDGLSLRLSDHAPVVARFALG